MKLSPLDIRKQEFSRGFRGYDADEVDAFLQMVASQWEEAQDARRRLESRVEDLEGKVRHYERVEEALQEALATARQNARQIVDGAHHKAQSLLNEAEVKAQDVKRGAAEERHRLKREIARLGNRQSEVVARLRAFLMSELELLARFEGDDPIGFIKLLPAREAAEPEAAPPRRLAERPDGTDRERPAASQKASSEATRPAERAAPSRTDAERRRPETPAASDPAAPAPRSVPPPSARPATPSGSVPTTRRAPLPPPSPTPPDAPSEPRTPREAADWLVEPLADEPAPGGDASDGDASESDLPAPDRLAGTSDEIDRIRRILRDLD